MGSGEMESMAVRTQEIYARHFGPVRQALCCLGLRERSYITKKLTGQTTGASEVRDMGFSPRDAEPGGLVPHSTLSF